MTGILGSSMLILLLLLVLIGYFLFSAIFIVKQQTEAIIERFGKYRRVCTRLRKSWSGGFNSWIW